MSCFEFALNGLLVLTSALFDLMLALNTVHFLVVLLQRLFKVFISIIACWSSTRRLLSITDGFPASNAASSQLLAIDDGDLRSLVTSTTCDESDFWLKAQLTFARMVPSRIACDPSASRRTEIAPFFDLREYYVSYVVIVRKSNEDTGAMVGAKKKDESLLLLEVLVHLPSRLGIMAREPMMVDTTAAIAVMMLYDGHQVRDHQYYLTHECIIDFA